MTETASEFDRALILRRVAFHREILTASLEGTGWNWMPQRSETIPAPRPPRWWTTILLS